MRRLAPLLHPCCARRDEMKRSCGVKYLFIALCLCIAGLVLANPATAATMGMDT